MGDFLCQWGKPRGLEDAEGGGCHYHHRGALETTASLGQEELVGRSRANLEAQYPCSHPSFLQAMVKG